jgi:predicted ATPase
MRRGIAACHNMGNLIYTTPFETALAEAEAEAGEIETALASIDQAVDLTERTEQRWNEADIHRARGDILLKRDPANAGPAEEAFLTAIAIAQQQKARSLELRAALALAKAYQSTGRAADAHTVLAPAIKSFSPTPEFPEIAQAQMLLAALTETDEVKRATAWRQRQVRLQTSYGQAMMWSKGFGAAETEAAFRRASELAVGAAAAERLPAYYGLWVGRLLRGELASAQETAEVFLRDANSAGRMTEAAVASRILGMTCLWQGSFVEARAHLENSLKIYDPERDREAKFLFGWDTGASASAQAALTYWFLGEVVRAQERMEEAVAHAAESAHEPTLANTYFLKALFEMLRGDAVAARRAAETVVELGRKVELALLVAEGAVCSAWASARLSDSNSGTTELRHAIAAYSGQGNRAYMTLFQGELAALEAEREGSEEEALGLIDEALTLARETGEHSSDAFLHRLRGEILLKRDPASAEGAFLTAIAIAQQQKARSFELRAAMSMARLWRDQGKREEARDLLAPVYGWFTEGFDTLDLKEAKALLNKLVV